MNCIENGIILSIRLFSETAKIVTIFNRSLGKFSALFKNTRTSVQIGDISMVNWRGRSIDALGSVSIENITSPFVFAISDPLKIYAIESACSLCVNGLPTKAPHQQLFDCLEIFLRSTNKDNWLQTYLFFELSFLAQVGFGLDFSKCAVTGQKDVYYLSPKTGHSVTRSVGEKYKSRLFVIPQFLLNSQIEPSYYDIFLAMQITGHFLKMYFCDINNQELPLSRGCLMSDIYNDVCSYDKVSGDIE